MKWYLTLVSYTLLNFASFKRIEAQPTLTISTSSSSTPCYGDVVTLVCHHPEVATNKTKYFSSPTAWRQDDMGITPSTGVYGQADTSEDFTRTTLAINITVDHFGSKSFYYSCLLVLAGPNGLPSQEVKTSGNVTIDPLEPESVRFRKFICLNSSITVKWFQSTMSCDRELLSYYVFWNKTSNGTLSGGNYTTKLEYNITNITPGTYDVRVQRLVTGNSARVYSNAITQSVEPGKPQAICYTDPCLNRNFTITCLISEKHTSSNRIDEVYWSRDGQMAMGVNFTRSADGTELYINVTAFTIGNYSCGIRLMDGTEIEGETHSVKPLDKPKSPENVTWNSTSSVLSWVHSDSCFDSLVFYFNVTWMKKGSSTVFSQTINAMNMTLYLEGDGLYTTCVTAIPTTNDTLKSEEQCTNFSQGLNGSSSTVISKIIIATVIPGISLIIIIIVITTVIVILCRAIHRKRKTKGDYDCTDELQMKTQVNDEQQQSEEETNYVEKVNHPQTSRTESGTAFQRVGNHDPACEVYPRVVMANVIVESDLEVLPSGSQVPKGQEFTVNILMALKSLGAGFEGKERTLNQFTGVHNSVPFVAVCVYTSSDLTIKDVEDVIALKAKHSTRPTEGLLIATQDTIPRDCLLKLKSNECTFVPVGYYGQKGWEIEMVGKFKDVFPRRAQDIKPVEDLPTPVQNTSPEKNFPISSKHAEGITQTVKGRHSWTYSQSHIRF